MKTIVWDVDDVLNEFMRKWFEERWLPGHLDCRVTYREIRDNPPHKLLNVSMREYLASLDEFRLSGSYARLEPVPEVYRWFEQHGEEFRHAALTRVPLAAASVSAEWVLSRFGKWIRSFHFVPSYREGDRAPQYDENKGAYLNYLGKADLFIDDTLKNIEAARKAGIKTLVFPRPWNGSKLTVGQLLAKVAEAI